MFGSRLLGPLCFFYLCMSSPFSESWLASLASFDPWLVLTKISTISQAGGRKEEEEKEEDVSSNSYSIIYKTEQQCARTYIYEVRSIHPIFSSSYGCTNIEGLWEKSLEIFFFFPFPNKGERWGFCLRAKEIGRFYRIKDSLSFLQSLSRGLNGD